MKIIGKNSVVRLTPDVGINLYRIFQQAVQNAIKHSGASLLQVSLMKGQGFVMLCIHDNGKGFQWPLEIKPEHYGLINMKKRTEMIKAGFQVESTPGAGTKITIKVPVAG